MFKKLGLALLILMLAFGLAQAATVLNQNIMDTTFNNTTTSATSTVVDISGYDKVALYVVYDETEVGNSISAAVTLDVSYDNSHWLTGMSFLDIAGGATYQTSQTISADGWYVFWVTRDPCIPYIRIAVAATNTDADDLLNVKAYIVGKE